MIPWYVWAWLGFMVMALIVVLIKVYNRLMWPDKVVVDIKHKGQNLLVEGDGKIVRVKDEGGVVQKYKIRGIPELKELLEPPPQTVKYLLGGGLLSAGRTFLFGASEKPGAVTWQPLDAKDTSDLTPISRSWYLQEMVRADRRNPKRGLWNNPAFVSFITIFGCLAIIFVVAQFVVQPMFAAGSEQMAKGAQVYTSALALGDKIMVTLDHTTNLLATVAARLNITVNATTGPPSVPV